MAVPKNENDAAKMTRTAADALLDVARGKHAAATADPGASRSDANAERARRTGWSRPNSKQSPRS